MTAAVPSDLTIADKLFALDCPAGTVGLTDNQLAWLRTQHHGEPCVYVTTGPVVARADLDRALREVVGEADISDLDSASVGSVVAVGELAAPAHSSSFVLAVRHADGWLQSSCGPTFDEVDVADWCELADDIDPDADDFLDQLRAAVRDSGATPSSRVLIAG